MGYRGKVIEQERARQLRALGWTYKEICAELGVSKSSVSLWVRDVHIDQEGWAARVDTNRTSGVMKRRQRFEQKRLETVEHYRREGKNRLGRLSEEQFLAAGIALYAGEGAKTDGAVKFANTDSRMVTFFLAWLRHFFDIDESRLRLRIYLHEGLDLEEASAFWSDVTRIPLTQFTKPYRAVPDPTIRHTKHLMGCASVSYASAPTLRAIMGLVDALLPSLNGPG